MSNIDQQASQRKKRTQAKSNAVAYDKYDTLDETETSDWLYLAAHEKITLSVDKLNKYFFDRNN